MAEELARVITAAAFIIAIRKQPKCSLIKNQLNKLWKSAPVKRMNYKYLRQKEISYSTITAGDKKGGYRMIYTIWHHLCSDRSQRLCIFSMDTDVCLINCLVKSSRGMHTNVETMIALPPGGTEFRGVSQENVKPHILKRHLKMTHKAARHLRSETV